MSHKKHMVTGTGQFINGDYDHVMIHGDYNYGDAVDDGDIPRTPIQIYQV